MTHLARKGMIVPDASAAENWLARVGLYRFKGYAHHFKTGGVYTGVRFEDVRLIMLLDDELKVHILRGLQIIEVAVRVQINEHLTHHYHEHWYADERVLPRKRRLAGRNITMLTNAHELSGRVYSEFMKSTEDAPSHYRRAYDAWLLPPGWMVTEIMSFGNWSRIYASLPPADQAAIAATFNIHPDTLKGWLRDLTVLRNMCAHQARVWNRVLSPAELYEPDPIRRPLAASSYRIHRPETSLAPRLYSMHHLLTQLGEWQWTSGARLVNRFRGFGPEHTGFKEGWESQVEWL
ncbi:Abi family protein [Deinococcus fonticola]|uniref:Abi family protein n=1 Tax=Deinococcus fonticola TaxID=2528713 RepID=UPI0014306B2B|nr:Abi family protein [Deinococcus fonticola]